MIDFDALRKAGGSFTPGPGDFDAYQAWLKTCVCSGCGARYADRPRDADGKALDMWATETECMDCFRKRCTPETVSEVQK